MYSWKRSTIWAIASVIGGLVFTLLSGLYILKPLVIDAEIINFGFPLAWFAAGRKGLLGLGPWHYTFVWQSFIVDFMTYGLFVATAISIYFMSSQKRKNTITNHRV